MIVAPALPSRSFEARLLGVPMRIEQRMDLAAAIGQSRDGLQQRIGPCSGSAIDQKNALRACLRDDIGLAGQPQDKQVVRQFQRASAFGRRLRPCPIQPQNRRANDDSRRANRGLQ